jgi:hypothetical protein
LCAPVFDHVAVHVAVHVNVHADVNDNDNDNDNAASDLVCERQSHASPTGGLAAGAHVGPFLHQARSGKDDR